MSINNIFQPRDKSITDPSPKSRGLLSSSRRTKTASHLLGKLFANHYRYSCYISELKNSHGVKQNVCYISKKGNFKG